MMSGECRRDVTRRHAPLKKKPGSSDVSGFKASGTSKTCNSTLRKSLAETIAMHTSKSSALANRNARGEIQRRKVE